MAMAATMRQLEERQVDRLITHLLWSPKMDIIAVANVNNDVTLYRLNWQKIWVTEPSDHSVTALSWRPDGKVLAVAYENGKIDLFDVEDHQPILTLTEIKQQVSFMRWSSCGESEPYNETRGNLTASDNSEWDFLTKFPSLSKAFSYNPSKQEDIQTCRKLCAENCPSILICGTNKGQIYTFMSGHLQVGFIDVSKLLKQECSLKDIILAPFKLTSMVVLTTAVNEEEGEVTISLVKFPILSSCFSELCLLAEKRNILMGTIDYMKDTLKQIKEAWESILLEMDNKLTKLKMKMNDEHGMASDFLELLMFGTPSTELEDFLLRELGEKGLKKLGTSIEVSYSNIQRLVLKYLHTVSQAITFHLCETIGQIKASDKYESVLNVTVDNVSKSQKNAASFWAKGIELQQVIDEAMKCFKAFFKWLHIEILRLSDENVSEDLNKTTQQDIEFIAQFLQSFSQGIQDDGHTYLEKVGQYLKDEKLTQPVDRSNNRWYSFIEEHQDMSDIPEILFIDDQGSLIQTFQTLSDSIIDIFEALCSSDFTERCESIDTWKVSCPKLSKPRCSFSQIEYNTDDTSKAPVDKTYGMILWSGFVESEEQEQQTRSLYFEFNAQQQQSTNDHLKALWLEPGQIDRTEYQIVGVSFYTAEAISILTSSPDGQRLIQLPISHLEPFLRGLRLANARNISLGSSCLSTQSIMNIAGPACHRELETLNADTFAVSGPRKVAAFLFKNRKRIRIYDMEIEEEDEDEDTFANSGLSSDLNTSY